MLYSWGVDPENVAFLVWCLLLIFVQTKQLLLLGMRCNNWLFLISHCCEESTVAAPTKMMSGSICVRFCCGCPAPEHSWRLVHLHSPIILFLLSNESKDPTEQCLISLICERRSPPSLWGPRVFFFPSFLFIFFGSSSLRWSDTWMQMLLRGIGDWQMRRLQLPVYWVWSVASTLFGSVVYNRRWFQSNVYPIHPRNVETWDSWRPASGCS